MNKYLLVLGCIAALMAAGCSDNTDVSKSVNDAYHAHDGGAPPPPGAMKNATSAVGPYANSGGMPAGSNAPYSGAGSGPGQAPTGASK